MHSVACPAARPSWSGTSGNRWSHAIGIQLLHVLQLRQTNETKHIGKSMVPCPRSPLCCMFCNLAAWSGTLESQWLHSTCIQPVAFPSLGLTIVVRHIGKSMVLCHRHQHRCMFATRPDCLVRHIGTSMVACHRHSQRCTSCNSAVVVRHIGKSMVPCHRHPHRCMSSNSAVVVRHTGKSMVPCVGLHSVACPTTRPDRQWAGTSESRWFYAIGIHIVACPATRPDRRGQAHRKFDGLMLWHPHRCMFCNST